MNAIRFYREKNNISQKELADAVGVQPISISRYERSIRKLSVERAKCIAEYLSVDWTDLFKDVDNESES